MPRRSRRPPGTKKAAQLGHPPGFITDRRSRDCQCRAAGVGERRSAFLAAETSWRLQSVVRPCGVYTCTGDGPTAAVDGGPQPSAAKSHFRQRQPTNRTDRFMVHLCGPRERNFDVDNPSVADWNPAAAERGAIAGSGHRRTPRSTGWWKRWTAWVPADAHLGPRTDAERIGSGTEVVSIRVAAKGARNGTGPNARVFATP